MVWNCGHQSPGYGGHRHSPEQFHEPAIAGLLLHEKPVMLIS
jgi:hypothetical protein